MGLEHAVVSADAHLSFGFGRGLWISRRNSEVAGLLSGRAATDARRGSGFADRSDVWLWREVPGQVSEGDVCDGLDLWTDLRDSSHAERFDLLGNEGSVRAWQAFAAD